MTEHDYYCECDECTEAMYAALDRLNATLAKFGPSRATITGARPRPAPSFSHTEEDVQRTLEAAGGK